MSGQVTSEVSLVLGDEFAHVVVRKAPDVIQGAHHLVLGARLMQEIEKAVHGRFGVQAEVTLPTDGDGEQLSVRAQGEVEPSRLEACVREVLHQQMSWAVETHFKNAIRQTTATAKERVEVLRKEMAAWKAQEQEADAEVSALRDEVQRLKAETQKLVAERARLNTMYAQYLEGVSRQRSLTDRITQYLRDQTQYYHLLVQQSVDLAGYNRQLQQWWAPCAPFK